MQSKIKSIIKFTRLSAYLAICVVLVFPFNAAALSEELLDMYASNNIMFYDPEACSGDGSGGAVVGGEALISGSTAAEKVWSGLKSMGLSDEVTAGIMGNMQHESNSFNPAQHEGSFKSQWGSFDLAGNPETSYGLGLIQWSFERRINMYNYVKDRSPGLIKYFEDPFTYSYENNNVYGCNGDCFIRKAANDNEVNALYSLELTFLVNEELNVVSSYKPVLSKTSVYEAAKYFLENIEIPQNPYISSHPERATDAQKYYDQFHGQTSFGASSNGGSSSAAVNGTQVTLIGDSISNGSRTQLEAEMSGIDIHAQDSKMFSGTNSSNPSGLSILSDLKNSSQVRPVLVFALGTNQDNVTQDNIDEVITLGANASKIVFVTNYTTSGDYTSNNDLFRKASTDHPGRVVVADWAGAIKGKESTYLGGDGTHPNDEGKKLWASLIKEAISGTANVSSSSSECCDPASSNGDSSSFEGEKYADLTQGQLNGLMAIAKSENGGTLNALKMEVSIFANLFEYKRPTAERNGSNLVDYVVNGGWFNNAASKYDESYSGYTDAEMAAMKSVLIDGHRFIPPEVVEHDYIGDIDHIENDGTTVDMFVKSNWIKGKTVIFQSSASFSSPTSYIFYEWANPDGTEVDTSGISTPPHTGDPFGYYPNNPPKGNAIAGARAEACCDKTIGGVTKMTIDGHEYAFPLAGATKANYLQPSTFGSNESMLSKLPCNSLEAGVCHHDYHAVDMGLMMEMVNGKDPTAADWGGESGYPEYYYNSAGAPVVAFVGGTISYASEYHNQVPENWWSKCGQIGLDGEDGNHYWLGHLDYASMKVNAGDTVTAGQELAVVGAPQCAQGTQGHLHIDNYNGTQAKPTSWTVEVMDKLYEALPESDTGTGVVTCGNTGLKIGGMTFEEAQSYMAEYRQVVNDTQGKEYLTVTTVNGEQDTFGPIHCSDNNGGIPNAAKNCVSFSWWFLRRHVDHEVATANGDGMVNALKGVGFPTGTEPRPYAIFSWSGGEYGHTGVVLGVIDSNTFIVGESSCSANWKDEWAARTHQYTLDDGHNWTFAYTDDWIKF